MLGFRFFAAKPRAKKIPGMEVKTPNRFEILEAEDSWHQEDCRNEPVMGYSEARNKTEMWNPWWTRTLPHTQREKNAQLQFLEHGLDEEIANGLEEGWMRFARLWSC